MGTEIMISHTKQWSRVLYRQPNEIAYHHIQENKSSLKYKVGTDVSTIKEENITRLGWCRCVTTTSDGMDKEGEVHIIWGYLC